LFVSKIAFLACRKTMFICKKNKLLLHENLFILGGILLKWIGVKEGELELD